MKAIIDSDSIVYAVGFACQTPFFLVFEPDDEVPIAQFDDKETASKFTERLNIEGLRCQKLFDPYPTDEVEQVVDQRIQNILDGCGDVDSFELWLTYPDINNNFRRQVCPEYKAHREDFTKPYHYEHIRQYLIEQWGAQVAPEGLEADDQVSILGWQDEDVIVVSIDKDLDTVPGWRYSWETHNKKEEMYFVTEEEARKTFWISVLTGDNADNIKGLHRVGPKKAANQLKDCVTDKDYYNKCYKIYDAHDRLEDLDKNCELLYLLRSRDDNWEKFKARELSPAYQGLELL